MRKNGKAYRVGETRGYRRLKCLSIQSFYEISVNMEEEGKWRERGQAGIYGTVGLCYMRKTAITLLTIVIMMLGFNKSSQLQGFFMP